MKKLNKTRELYADFLDGIVVWEIYDCNFKEWTGQIILYVVIEK